MIPQSFIQELLTRVDVVDVVGKAVKLRKAGANYQGLCPFHNEKTPSFSVSPTKQFYHCFGCGAHGSAISFLMEHHGLGFVEAVHELARDVGLTVPEDHSREGAEAARKASQQLALSQWLDQAARYYRSRLKETPAAITYLKERGVTGETARHFGLGYAPAGWRNLEGVLPDYAAEDAVRAGLVIAGEDGKRYDRFRERIMFPIRNPRGQVIGFGGRVLGQGEPKYLNSPEGPLFSKGHELYGLFEAREGIRASGRVLVVEGYMDVVMLHQHGCQYAVATLGTARDEQIIDAITGEYRERFMMQYNMPPYATGETGRIGTPKRREVGHGRLAKRAITALVPSQEDFAYSIRLVSEITESNGSSSMASVCGGCLALMDAGVPVERHVAGIAMGLIKEGNKFAVLTDILGDEDHLGDMDFKVAGTEQGVTALQMDIKIQGITREIMQVALAQAREARMHILGKMQEAIPAARTELSDFAPRMYQMKINPERIRDVIGKGGATIRAITEETGTTIDIQDDGSITIAAVDAEAARRAQQRIADLTAEVEIGKIYNGTVLKILEFGAIVQVLPGRDGLLHVSQIAQERVNKVEDYVKEGQSVRVKVIEADDKGRLRLSMKAVAAEEANQSGEGA